MKIRINKLINIGFLIKVYNHTMAQGKTNKKFGGKKGKGKKIIDPLSRKEWYELKAPAPFEARSFGYTLANRTMGLSNLYSYLRKGRR